MANILIYPQKRLKVSLRHPSVSPKTSTKFTIVSFKDNDPPRILKRFPSKILSSCTVNIIIEKIIFTFISIILYLRSMPSTKFKLAN